MTKVRILKYFGDDEFYRPVYQDQYGKLWKDIGLPNGTPDLFSVSGNTLDGEPYLPLTEEYTVAKKQNKAYEQDYER